MASAFGHAAAAYGLLKIHPDKIFTTKVLILGIVSSIIPDIDVMCFKFGIDDLHILGHRGLTHSIAFGLVWALMLIIIFHAKDKHSKILFLYYSLTTISHGVFDAMTTGGAGIAFLYPFSVERLFLPFRFIQVSPIGTADFFSSWGLEVIISELRTIGIFCIALMLIGRWLNKKVYL